MKYVQGRVRIKLGDMHAIIDEDAFDYSSKSNDHKVRIVVPLITTYLESHPELIEIVRHEVGGDQ